MMGLQEFIVRVPSLDGEGAEIIGKIFDDERPLRWIAGGGVAVQGHCLHVVYGKMILRAHVQ